MLRLFQKTRRNDACSAVTAESPGDAMTDRFSVTRTTDRRRLIQEGEEEEAHRGTLGYGATGIDLGGELQEGFHIF